MTKIMLVEDDKSLREIYGVRLLAEGYDIVSAGDGEEALAMAIKERPNLIVSDVMMPKISGFDMLDILRSTTETKNIKVIMMTALSSEEQRQRGESLGADRYLVKSQVGIEDVVRVVHEVLADGVASAMPQAPNVPTPAQGPSPDSTIPAFVPNTSAAPQATPAPAPVTAPAPVPSAMPTPTVPAAPAPISPAAPRPQPQAPPAPAPQAAPAPIPVPQPQTAPQPAARPNINQPGTTPTPQFSVGAPQSPSNHSRVIQPLNDPSITRVDINDLLDKELAKEAGVDMDNRPPVASIEQEKDIINDQLGQFNPPSISVPAISIDEDGDVSSYTATGQQSDQTDQQLPPAAPGTPPSQPPSAPTPNA